MPFGVEPGHWNYGVCESCLKNAGDTVNMIKEKLDAHHHIEHFVCPQCGATKRL